MSMSTNCDTGKIVSNGLNHTSDMDENEHARFVKSFDMFKTQTDFFNEVDPKMLKYYVQMAYLEGWKKSKSEV